MRYILFAILTSIAGHCVSEEEYPSLPAGAEALATSQHEEKSVAAYYCEDKLIIFTKYSNPTLSVKLNELSISHIKLNPNNFGAKEMVFTNGKVNSYIHEYINGDVTYSSIKIDLSDDFSINEIKYRALPVSKDSLALVGSNQTILKCEKTPTSDFLEKSVNSFIRGDYQMQDSISHLNEMFIDRKK